ncbi:hypothetical protein HYV11_03805 [Candidatus Dependentiae bacterium]|nr:hypothetical protein [Candidatus Dependentiae bacterium]
MKFVAIFSFYFLLQITIFLQGSSWLTSGAISSDQKKLVDSVTSYPMMGTIVNDDGVTYRAQQILKDRTIAATVPKNVQPILKHGGFSILRGKDTDFKNYPRGNSLFPHYPILSAKFDEMISMMVSTPKFKAFFNKIHLNVLNELYSYLMGIYTNFNLQHVGIEEVKNSDGTMAYKLNVPLFLQDEKEYDANKKTLIINHLINVIESQMNGKIKSIMPKVPHLFATYAGKTIIQNDFSIDLTQFIVKQTHPELQKYKQLYLHGLATYLSFFKEYTSFLDKPHPQKQQHFTAFVAIAEAINQFIYGSVDLAERNADPKNQMKMLLQKMDPPLFTYNYDDIRALKLIPHLAKSLSPESKSVKWPSHIVDAAEKEMLISNHPIAYFKDDNSNVVKKDRAEHLYVVLQSGANFFQEELVAQPEWLNSWQGVERILKACFGDFSALVGLQILDPCMEHLIANAISVMNGEAIIEDDSLAHSCHILLDAIEDKKVPQKSAQLPKTQISIDSLLSSPISQPDQSVQNGFTPSLSDISLSPSSTDIGPSVDDISMMNQT